MSRRKKRYIGPWDAFTGSITRTDRQTREAETELEVEMRSYGSRLRYECGLARKFYDEESEDFYDERWMQCNWNQTWTQHDTLDDCVWTQCLYPPEPPPETQLILTWNEEPVDFNDNVSYVCGDQYFEWDRDLPEFNITCLEDGSWDAPEVWPNCVPSKIKRILNLVYLTNPNFQLSTVQKLLKCLQVEHGSGVEVLSIPLRHITLVDHMAILLMVMENCMKHWCQCAVGTSLGHQVKLTHVLPPLVLLFHSLQRILE